MNSSSIVITEIEISKSFIEDVFIKYYSYIINRKSYINEMNWFPVRDMDTGNNLYATVRGILKGIKKTMKHSKKDFVEELIEDTLLESGRGNAGVIFTSWFTGFLDSLKDDMILNTETLSLAMNKGNAQALKAFSNPRRGTILDPISIVNKTANSICEREINIISLMDKIIDDANIAVENTTEQLDNLLKEKYSKEVIDGLKKDNVIDAGALGFLLFLKAFKESIMNRINVTGGFVFVLDNLICKDRKVIMEKFSHLGDSLDINVSPSGKKALVHIHSNSPDEIFEIVKTIGNIKELRIEDLTEDN